MDGHRLYKLLWVYCYGHTGVRRNRQAGRRGKGLKTEERERGERERGGGGAERERERCGRGGGGEGQTDRESEQARRAAQLANRAEILRGWKNFFET